MGKNEVVLIPPPSWNRPNGISVDACIADAIRMLWDNGIVTGGCCCGHNRAYPSVVIESGEDAEKTKWLLLEHDGRRHWDVFQWRLTKC